MNTQIFYYIGWLLLLYWQITTLEELGGPCGVNLAADIGGRQSEVACSGVVGGKKTFVCQRLRLPLCAISSVHTLRNRY